MASIASAGSSDSFMFQMDGEEGPTLGAPFSNLTNRGIFR